MHGEPTGSHVSRTSSMDVGVAFALLTVGMVGARFLFQDRMMVDGAGLATFYAEGQTLAYHFLFLPVCRLLAPLAELTRPGDPIEATRLACALGFGLGSAFTWLFVREFLSEPGARGAALVATLLVALSPAALFFGTTVEVHALHFATVAVAAWKVPRLPWRMPVPATAMAAMLLGVVFWGHQLGVLLGPGWVLLCGVSARRAGRPLSARSLLLGVGPGLLAGVLAGSALANYLRSGSVLPSAEHELGILETFSRPEEAWRFGWDGWLRPLALVLPLAAVGFVRGGLDRGVRVALAALIGAPLAFLFAWGVHEHGGYALGHAPFLALLAAAAMRPLAGQPARFWMAAFIVLSAQAGLALETVRRMGAGFDVEERVALIEEHLQGGTFLAVAPNAPSYTVYRPDAFEVVTDHILLKSVADGIPSEEISALLLAGARAELARTGRLILDLGYETQLDRAPLRNRAVVLDPVRDALIAEFKTTRVDHEHWPLLIVEP